MTEHEWVGEARRVPRTRRRGFATESPSKPDALATYVALEFPRETVTWLLRARHEGSTDRPASGETIAKGRPRDWVLPPRLL